MAKCAMMSDFLISLPDRPGELARLAKILREAEVNLVGLWGYGRGEGKARLYCVPQNAEEFRRFAESAGLDVNHRGRSPRGPAGLPGQDRHGGDQPPRH